jgi:hypothetical protein
MIIILDLIKMLNLPMGEIRQFFFCTRMTHYVL